jgi:hypothetical protein
MRSAPPTNKEKKERPKVRNEREAKLKEHKTKSGANLTKESP